MTKKQKKENSNKRRKIVKVPEKISQFSEQIVSSSHLKNLNNSINDDLENDLDSKFNSKNNKRICKRGGHHKSNKDSSNCNRTFAKTGECKMLKKTPTQVIKQQQPISNNLQIEFQPILNQISSNSSISVVAQVQKINIEPDLSGKDNKLDQLFNSNAFECDVDSFRMWVRTAKLKNLSMRWRLNKTLRRLKDDQVGQMLPITDAPFMIFAQIKYDQLIKQLDRRNIYVTSSEKDVLTVKQIWISISQIQNILFSYSISFVRVLGADLKDKSFMYLSTIYQKHKENSFDFAITIKSPDDKIELVNHTFFKRITRNSQNKSTLYHMCGIQDYGTLQNSQLKIYNTLAHHLKKKTKFQWKIDKKNLSKKVLHNKLQSIQKLIKQIRQKRLQTSIRIQITVKTYSQQFRDIVYSACNKLVNLAKNVMTNRSNHKLIGKNQLCRRVQLFIKFIIQRIEGKQVNVNDKFSLLLELYNLCGWSNSWTNAIFNNRKKQRKMHEQEYQNSNSDIQVQIQMPDFTFFDQCAKRMKQCQLKQGILTSVIKFDENCENQPLLDDQIDIFIQQQQKSYIQRQNKMKKLELQQKQLKISINSKFFITSQLNQQQKARKIELQRFLQELNKDQSQDIIQQKENQQKQLTIIPNQKKQMAIQQKQMAIQQKQMAIQQKQMIVQHIQPEIHYNIDNNNDNPKGNNKFDQQIQVPNDILDQQIKVPNDILDRKIKLVDEGINTPKQIFQKKLSRLSQLRQRFLMLSSSAFQNLIVKDRFVLLKRVYAQTTQQQVIQQEYNQTPIWIMLAKQQIKKSYQIDDANDKQIKRLLSRTYVFKELDEIIYLCSVLRYTVYNSNDLQDISKVQYLCRLQRQSIGKIGDSRKVWLIFINIIQEPFYSQSNSSESNRVKSISKRFYKSKFISIYTWQSLLMVKLRIEEIALKSQNKTIIKASKHYIKGVNIMGQVKYKSSSTDMEKKALTNVVNICSSLMKGEMSQAIIVKKLHETRDILMNFPRKADQILNNLQKTSKQQQQNNFQFIKVKMQYFGMRNRFHQCYSNASLQIIFNIKQFFDFIGRSSDKISYILLEMNVLRLKGALIQLQIQKDILHTALKRNQQFSYKIQQDAHQYLLYLIDGIKGLQKGHQHIVQAIYITLKETIACLHCNKTQSKQLQPQLGLSLIFERWINVQHHLNDHLSKQIILDFKCSCSIKGSTKIYQVVKVPKIFMCHLKVFDINSKSGRQQKKNITIKHILDSQTIYLGGKKFELSGLILHSGKNTHQGHYVSVCKQTVNKKDVWIIYNDITVTQFKKISQIAGSFTDLTPYVLFYVRCDEA